MPSDFCAEHYSFECEHDKPVQFRAQPVGVWVAVELYTKSVQVAAGAATGQISGKASIFQRPEVTQQLAAKILGVFDTRAQAELKCAQSAQKDAEHIIEYHRLGSALAPTPILPAAPAESKCILCGTPSPTTFCKSCEQKRFAEMRQRDAGIISEVVAAHA